MKKLQALALALILAVVLSGCGGLFSSGGGVLVGNSIAPQVPSSLPPVSSSEVPSPPSVPPQAAAYAIGDKVQTAWFDFVVESAAFVDKYAGYAADAGKKLVDVVIITTNTFDDAVPMFDTDYIIEWGKGEAAGEYSYCLDALDATMAEGEYELPEGESMERHYVFEVPADATELVISFTEIYSGGSEGNTYKVALGL